MEEPRLGDLGATYARHAEHVRRAAYAVTRDRSLAEDVTQEVFLALWVKPERYDPRRGTLQALLRVMARSRALDAARHAGAVQRAHDRLEAEPSGPCPHDPAEAASDALRTHRVRRAVRDLPAEQREAIGLAYWGGLTADEVARRRGIPHGTAKSRIRIGLDKLRVELDE